MQNTRAREGGFTIVEIAMGVVLLAVGALGFISAIIGSQLSIRANQELSIVNAAFVTAVENFRESCRSSFDSTVTSYAAGVNVTGTLMRGLNTPSLTATVTLSEPGQVPLIDLNGDGDTLDSGLTASQVNAAVVQFTATWRGVLGRRSVVHKTILARDDV